MHGSAVELSFAIGMMALSLLFSGVLKVEHKIRVSFIGLLGMGVSSCFGYNPICIKSKE